MNTVQQLERPPRALAPPYINEYTKYEAACRHRAWVYAVWRIAPHVIADEGGGDYVVLDASLLPIVRVFADGRMEILEPNAEYDCSGGLEYIYQGYAYPPTKMDQARIVGFIEVCGLRSELQRRRELLRRDELSGGWRW